jgi:hypothetical protein
MTAAVRDIAAGLDEQGELGCLADEVVVCVTDVDSQECHIIQDTRC